MSESDEIRTRILDAAHATVAAKGFGAISIRELIAAAGMGEAAFISHFRDETEVARALLRRELDETEWLHDEVFARARDLVDDPLQVLLVGLRLLADRLAERPHPGSLVAASRMPGARVDREVRETARLGTLRCRTRFRGIFEEIVGMHPPREPIAAEDFADMVLSAIEGGTVLARVLDDPGILPRQIMVLRSQVKLLFAPEERAAAKPDNAS